MMYDFPRVANPGLRGRREAAFAFLGATPVGSLTRELSQATLIVSL